MKKSAKKKWKWPRILRHSIEKTYIFKTEPSWPAERIVRAVVLRPQIKVSGIDRSLEKTSRPLIRFNSVALKLALVPTLIRHGYYLSKAVDWPSVWHVWKMVSNQLPRNPMGVSNWIDEKKKTFLFVRFYWNVDTLNRSCTTRMSWQ